MAIKSNPSYMDFYEELPATDPVDDVENDADDSLEDSDISFDDAEDDAVSEPEKDAEEDSDTEDESEEVAEDAAPADDTETTEEPTAEEKQKQHNREMAERRLQAKQEREAKIRAEQQEYVAAADPEDPRDIAVRQLQIDAYNNRVESNSNKLTNGYEKAIKDFDILQDATPEIQAEIDQAIDAFQAMYVTVDTYGNPIEVRGDLYTYLQTKADSIKQLTGIGARQQQTSKDKERSKTLTPPNRAPKQAKSDPDLDGFDEEAKRW